MTIQAGLTGPPHVPELRIRVWSDRPGTDIRITHAHTGAPVAGVSVTAALLPFALAAAPTLSRRIVEIGQLPFDTPLKVEMAGEACTVLTPPAPEGELRILMGSCFFLPDDRGKLATAYANLREQDRPHLRLQAGDQLYLDAGELPDGPTALDRTLARYRQYWQDDKYGEYLRSGAVLFAPDDHDYWNDYPFRMPHLSRSWDGKWREHAAAAELAYMAYEALGNPDARTWFVLDLGLISLFVLDTRTRRGTSDRNPPARLFDQDQRDALTAWSTGLRKPGVVLSAMPLFQKPEGKFLFITGDHNLLAWPNDARVIWRAVESASADVLLLAGDIHQGRMLEWRTGPIGAVRQHFEIVSSPLSLLGWPTKSKREVKSPPTGLQLGQDLGRRDPTRIINSTSRDHFALLRFSPGPSAVQVRATLHRLPDTLIPASESGDATDCQLELLLRTEV
jgi:PhoD-like phosphatase